MPKQIRICPAEVPDRIAKLYRQAAKNVEDSPMGSAVLSRRCLEDVLREAGGAEARDLKGLIKQVMDKVPSYVAAALDELRMIGNFAAHPIKNRHTDEVIEVEPGEAEQCLDTLDALFDHYYVAPARAKARRDKFNQKLLSHGKEPLPPLP